MTCQQNMCTGEEHESAHQRAHLVSSGYDMFWAHMAPWRGCSFQMDMSSGSKCTHFFVFTSIIFSIYPEALIHWHKDPVGLLYTNMTCRIQCALHMGQKWSPGRQGKCIPRVENIASQLLPYIDRFWVEWHCWCLCNHVWTCANEYYHIF